ncbi:MAG: YncE family protein [bacterium]
MKGRTWVVWGSWGKRIASSVALAIAIVMAGAFCPAPAAAGSTVYVSNVDSDSVSAIDSETHSVVEIPVGNEPGNLAATPDGKHVYVPNRYPTGTPEAPSRAGVGVRASSTGYGNVSVIDTATNTVVATIEDSSFDEPYAVAVKPDGSEAWVVNNFSGTVSIIDTSTNTVSETIVNECISYPEGIAINPNTAIPQAYVVNSETSTVCVFNTSTREYVDTVDVGSGPHYAAVTPDGGAVYVSGDYVVKIDTSDLSTTWFDGEDADYAYGRNMAVYSGVGSTDYKVYVAPQDNFLYVILSDDTVDTINFSYGEGEYPSLYGVAIVPGTNFGFATDENGFYDYQTGIYRNGRVFVFDAELETEITGTGLPIMDDSFNTPRAITAVTVGSAPTALDLQNNGLGAGWIGSCGMVVGRDGKGPMSAGESAGMIALYFALLLLPVGILKLVHGRKRLPLEKAGIVALFIVASMLVASSAHAERIVAPKAQRFHPTTDGQGALTVDTDQPLCPGQFNVGLTLSGAKKPLDMGDIRELKIEKVVVDELYTADLTVAYGLTPDITLGLDVPYDYSRDNLNYADFRRNGAPGVRDDVFHLGDIRLNAKFRVIEGNGYGLALIPFANFATGDRDYLLSEGKFGFGMKAAGHFDVAKPLTLYANLGAEHIGDIATPSSGAGYYTPWIQYGVGAKYLLPWRKDSIVAEVNGETSWATPYAHSTLSPLEVLAAYRAEVAPGWTLQAGGGGGLNKGMGAPQWRAILGIAYKM